MPKSPRSIRTIKACKRALYRDRTEPDFTAQASKLVYLHHSAIDLELSSTLP